jgi:hypothetical protein
VKLKQIHLDERPDFKEPGAYPTSCVVEMTIEEAAYLSQILGRINDHDKEAIVRGAAGFDIWHCLNGDLFDRFWDEGDSGAMRDLGIWPTADAKERAAESGKLQWRD